MSKRTSILVLAGLAASACSEVSSNETQPAIKITNPYHDQLAALPPDLQRLGLMRAIRDNRQRCLRVEEARYQQDHDQMAMWVARCAEGTHWAIFIGVNGDAQVRDCAHSRQLNLPLCRPISGPGSDLPPRR
jgi:hypothetical protein